MRDCKDFDSLALDFALGLVDHFFEEKSSHGILRRQVSSLNLAQKLIAFLFALEAGLEFLQGDPLLLVYSFHGLWLN